MKTQSCVTFTQVPFSCEREEERLFDSNKQQQHFVHLHTPPVVAILFIITSINRHWCDHLQVL